MSMARLRAVGLSHRGKVREHNEDCLALGGWLCLGAEGRPMRLEWQGDAALFVIADGMGGHAAGEVASRVAVESLLRDLPAAPGEAAIAEAINHANAAVQDAMGDDPARNGMGTTVAGLLIAEAEAYSFNVGDSRVYRVVSGYLRLLTEDDTREFRMQGASASVGKRSGTLIQCLGGASAQIEVEPHISRLTLSHIERFLLCSDGLTDMLDQDTLEDCLDPDPDRTVQRLFDAAMAAGGADNISVAIVDYQTDPNPLPRGRQR